jgi:tRNA A-37 threonylcarbamoyl transferase component Bud32/tetratricopeptide (TPR) repeat protein
VTDAARLSSQFSTALADRYRLERKLGEGGMSIVFLARDLRHERLVAVKMLRPELSAALGSERFLREIRIVAGLQHPHILPLHDSGEAGGILYYVMPYVEGESLRQRLDRNGALRPVDVLQIAREVASALDYAHAHGVIHRDVKPENILLSGQHAIVADFGIARAVDAAGGATATATGIVVGTPAYMSPEQAAGEAVDARSDQYSFACVIYEMLSGAAPFAGTTARELMARHAIEPVPPLSSVRPDLPPLLSASLARGLEKQPAARYHSTGSLVAALDGTNTPPGATTQVSLEAAAPVRHPRRAGTLAVLGLLGAIAVGVGIWGVRGRDPAAPAMPAATPVVATAVAVLPFAVSGSDTLGLGEGLVSLLGTKLDGAGDIRVVDSRALLSHVAQEGLSRPGPTEGSAVARHFGAGLFVLGDVVQIPGRLRLSASLYAPDRRDALARAEAEGEVGRLFELVDQVTAQLLAGWSGRESRVSGIAAVTTTSLPALKAYLEGEAALRAARFDQAIDGFERAIATDSNFALAWYRLSVAGEWLTRDDLVARAAERAAQLADRLPERERRLLEARRAGRRGAFDEAMRRYQAIIATHPEDIEAWIQLGELQFHFGPWRARSVSEARTAWERVLALDQGEVAARVHLARIAAFERKPEEVDALVRQILSRSDASDRPPGTRSEELEMLTLRAFAVHDTLEQRRLMGELAQGSDLTLMLAAWEAASFAGDVPGSIGIARLLTGTSRSAPARAAGHLTIGMLEAARGRVAEARRQLALAEAADPSRGRSAMALLAVAPFARSSAAELRQLRSALAAAPVPPPDDARVGLSVYFQRAPEAQDRRARLYLSALLSAALGDRAQAARNAAALDALVRSDSSSLAEDFARGIRAELAMNRNDPGEALRELERVRHETYYVTAFAFPELSQARERYLQGEALAAVGREEEALRWFTSFVEFSPYDLLYAPIGHRRRGEILESLGRREEAAAEYAAFLDWWKDADPELQPQVREVKAALARVRSAP